MQMVIKLNKELNHNYLPSRMRFDFVLEIHFKGDKN